MAGSLGTLHKPTVESVLDRLDRDADAIAARMARASLDEVDEYAAIQDPAFVAEVTAHAGEHVVAFVRAGRGGRPPAGSELDFVRDRGAQRARELMPLDALLEAYLIGQRTVWEAIVSAAGDSPEGMHVAQELTALTFRYTHAINVAVADSYLRESKALASEVERSRRDLLDRLLSGREPGHEEERRAEALGLRVGADHVVVVAESAQGEDDGARRVMDALARQEPERPFVLARHDEVIAIIPVYVRRGPRELGAELERTAGILSRKHGVELRAGVSSVCVGLAGTARAYGEAARALRHAGRDNPVVTLEQIGLLDYLTEGADETARRLVSAGAAALLTADERQDGTLRDTLRTYADCDMNVARTAARLTVHPNTVHYRLRRVQELSGHDPRSFDDLAELLTALRLLRQD